MKIHMVSWRASELAPIFQQPTASSVLSVLSFFLSRLTLLPLVACFVFSARLINARDAWSTTVCFPFIFRVLTSFLVEVTKWPAP